MAATQKAIALARQLAENISLRTGLAVVSGFDSSGNPIITVGPATIGSQSAFIRVKQDYDPALETDGIGNTQRRYTPHVIQLVLETSSVANVALMTTVNLTRLMRDLDDAGTKIEVYMSANGNAVDVSDITSTNLKATIDSLWHPMTSTI
jgi:hypothetical protein